MGDKDLPPGPGNGLSDVSRTSPTVLKPAAARTFRIRGGNSTSLTKVSSAALVLE
jgi:hypothetical protein